MLKQYNAASVVCANERDVLATFERSECMHFKPFTERVLSATGKVEISVDGLVGVCCRRVPQAMPRCLYIRVRAPPADLARLLRSIKQEFAGPLVHGVLDLQFSPGLNLIPEYQESKRSTLGPRRSVILSALGILVHLYFKIFNPWSC